MTRTSLWVAAVAILLAVGMMARPSTALAEDVVVKQIKPDEQPKVDQPKTPADQPKPPAPRPSDVPAWMSPDYRPVGGDVVVDSALRNSGLTDAQKAKLQPLTDGLEKENKAALKDFMAKLDPIKTKQHAALKAAQDAGAKSPFEQPEVKALMEERGKLMTEYSKQADQRREKFISDLAGVLTPGQMRKVSSQIRMSSSDPAVREQASAWNHIAAAMPGVELTDQQYDQIVTNIQPLLADNSKYFADAQKTMQPVFNKLAQDPNDADAKKALADYHAKLKANREAIQKAIEDLLTPEQKQKAAQGRFQETCRVILHAVDGQVDYANRGNLTDAQKQDVNRLADAARDAIGKLTPQDPAGPMEVLKQLQQNVDKLLTDEQKAAIKASFAPRR